MATFRRRMRNMCIGSCMLHEKISLFSHVKILWFRIQFWCMSSLLCFQWQYTRRRYRKGRNDRELPPAHSAARHRLPSLCLCPVQTGEQNGLFRAQGHAQGVRNFVLLIFFISWDHKFRSKWKNRVSIYSINQSINQSMHQSINQSINQSMHQSINQPINRSINQADERTINMVRYVSLSRSCSLNVGISVLFLLFFVFF